MRARNFQPLLVSELIRQSALVNFILFLNIFVISKNILKEKETFLLFLASFALVIQKSLKAFKKA